MALLNYRTRVDATRTAAEIQAILAKAGAKRIMQEFDDAGEVSSLAFQLKIADGQLASFQLPVDWRPVDAVLRKQKVNAGEATARNVAWRIVKDWVEAQVAIIETKMVEPEQVFLPYLISSGGKTVYEHFKDDSRFLLGSGDGQR